MEESHEFSDAFGEFEIDEEDHVSEESLNGFDIFESIEVTIPDDLTEDDLLIL